MSHRYEDCFVKRSDHNFIRDGLGGPMVSRAEAVNQYKKPGNKWKKYLKDLKKQNKMLYRIANNFGSRREIKKSKKIKAKASNKRRDDRSDSSRNKSYYDSSLSSDSN